MEWNPVRFLYAQGGAFDQRCDFGRNRRASMIWINRKINLKRFSWAMRIIGVMGVLLLIFIAPLLANDQVHAIDSWRRILAYPYSSLIHQGSAGGSSTGGVMAFTSSALFYQVPNVSSCGFGGPGGCFSYIFDYDADDNPIFGCG